MAQTFYPITPTEITPSGANDWVTMDASALAPANATGVILHCVSAGADAFGLRKSGSTDDRSSALSANIHFWAMIGVDASRYFEAYVGSTTNIDIYVVGYTMAGVTFATNADDMSLGSTGDWYDIDCSTEAPSAIGLIWEVQGSSTVYQFGLRKNGSSDDRHFDTKNHTSFGAVIGCDASQICEGYIENTAVDFFLVGYITDGATFNTNATDVSLGTADSWLDLTALPDENPNMGFIEAIDLYGMGYGLRKNGSAEDIYYAGEYHCWGIVECDASRLIEGKIGHTSVDFFVVGYSTAVVGGETYEVSVTDGVKMGDTRAHTMTIPVSVTDGLKGGDTPATQASFQKTLTNGAKLGDSPSTQANLFSALIDGLKAGDSPAAGLAYPVSVSDGVKLGDSLSHTYETNPVLTDGVKAGDSPSTQAILQALLTDGAKLGELPSTQAILYNTLTDGVKLGDTPLSNLIYYCILQDGVKLGDVLSHLYEANPTVADGVKLGDASSTQAVLQALLTDGAKLGDTPSTQAILQALLTDGAKLGDSSSASRTSQVILTDGVKMADITSALMEMQVSVTDGVKMGDLATYLGRVLKLIIITSHYRQPKILTSLYRNLKLMTGQYRQLKVLTGLYRGVKTITSLWRRVKTILSGG